MPFLWLYLGRKGTSFSIISHPVQVHIPLQQKRGAEFFLTSDYSSLSIFVASRAILRELNVLGRNREQRTSARRTTKKCWKKCSINGSITRANERSFNFKVGAEPTKTSSSSCDLLFPSVCVAQLLMDPILRRILHPNVGLHPPIAHLKRHTMDCNNSNPTAIQTAITAIITAIHFPWTSLVLYITYHI